MHKTTLSLLLYRQIRDEATLPMLVGVLVSLSLPRFRGRQNWLFVLQHLQERSLGRGASQSSYILVIEQQERAGWSLITHRKRNANGLSQQHSNVLDSLRNSPVEGFL